VKASDPPSRRSRRAEFLYEEFARFLEQPSRETLRDLLANRVGEFDQLDFKKQWIDDAPLARHMLGMANSGGGCLVFGVEQNDNGTLVPIGLSALRDRSNLHDGVGKFLPHKLAYDLRDFDYHSSEYPLLIGKRFQVLFVDDTPRYLPFISTREFSGKIRRAAIYVRRGAESCEASYEELQQILNQRIATEYVSTSELNLDRECAELRLLYEQVNPAMLDWHLQGRPYEGPNISLSENDDPAFWYYQSFLVVLIDQKTARISQLVGSPEPVHSEPFSCEPE